MNLCAYLARRLALILGVALPSLLLAQGYQQPDLDVPDTPSGSGGTTRRTPGLFTRLFNSPARTNAAEQMALAKNCEAEGRLRRALKGYKALFLFWPTAPEAPEALNAYARLLQGKGKYDAAFSEYQYLIDQYAGRFPYDAVIEAQYAIANQVRTERYGRWFLGIGFVSPERAIPYYYQVASNAPNSALAPEGLFSAGAIFQQKEQFEEAIRTYADIQTRYPGTDESASAAAEQLQCMLGIARREPNNSRYAADTRTALKLYLRDHPDAPNREALESAIRELEARLAKTLMDNGLVYERARKPEAALKQYRELVDTYADSPHAGEARQKIEALEKAIAAKGDARP